MRPQDNSIDATRSTLLRRVRDLDDKEGWAEFDKLYRPLLVGYARRRYVPADVAEELAQQCLVAIVSRIGQFEKKSSFRGWLRAMVDHKISDHFTKKSRERSADTGVLRHSPDPGPTPAEAWEKSWDEAHLTHFVATLRTNFAQHTLQAFALYVLQERPVREISEVLSMTPNQVYVAKSRVLRFIRERCEHVVEGLYGVEV
ncbi:MAG: sigma-70 family RNA polymerase sigma factor [Phycisphaerae bacterium]|jgi:RNA polymerase sigma-70 factor (ECF subfamily)